MTGSAFRPRRILFVVPSLRRAGAETQVIDLANAVDPALFEGHLAFFEAHADQAARVGTHVTVHRLRRRAKLDLALARALAQVINEHRIDVVHCTLQISLFFTALALAMTRRRPAVVAAVHTTVNRGLREELYDRLLYRRLLARCDRIVFVCEAQAEYWTRRYPELRHAAAVVYNGVDTAAYDPDSARTAGAGLRRELGIGPGQRVVACIAGLRPEKGHRFLLTAFAGLTGNPHLLLAGDGPERLPLEALARELRVSDRVHALGEVTDVRPVIGAAQVTVLASTAVETFSISMLESMALEVPVVATRVGGLGEAIEAGRSGDLVAPGDVPALRASLQRLLDDAEASLAMGRAARECVRKRFSVHAMASGTTDVLSAVLADRIQYP